MLLVADITPIERQALWFAAWVVGGVAAGQIVYWIWNAVLLRLAGFTKTDLDEAVITATRGPARFVTVVLALRIGTQLTLARVPNIAEEPGWPVWEGVLYVLVVLAVTVLALAGVSAFTQWYCKRAATHTSHTLGEQFISVFRKLAKFVFFFIALTIVFDHFGIRITGLLATAGVASLAVAFAAQETLANMIAGFVLMVDRPFKSGDRIQLPDGQMGDVIEVGLRSTRVMSFDNTVIMLPNSEVAKGRIINLNAPDANVKIRCTLGVAYGSDLRKVKAVLTDIMASHPDVLKEPAPAVFFTEFAESSLNLLFVCRVADYREKFRILDELNMAIKDRFEEGGIEIPFPQRDVHVRVHGLEGKGGTPCCEAPKT